jgi:O-antigen/teichoic acid export membrane protein
MNSSIKHVGQKSFLVTIGNVISRIINFIFAIIVGRLLGAATYVEYIYLLSFLSFFLILSKLGLGSGAVHFLPRYKEDPLERHRISSLVLVIPILTSLLVITLLVIFSGSISEHLLNDPAYRTNFLLMTPSILILGLQGGMLSLLRASKRIKEQIFVKNLIIPISKLLLLVVFVMIFRVQNIYSLIIPFYIYTICIVIFLAWRLKTYGLIGQFSFSSPMAKRMLHFSMPLLFSGLVGVISGNIDQFMIGYYLDSSQVGIYRVARQFAGLTTIAYASLLTTIGPVIAELYHKDKIDELKELYVLSTKWVSVFNLLLFGILLLLAPDLMRVVGPEFVSGSAVLIIVGLGLIVNAMTGTADSINIMTGHPRYSLYTKLVVMGSNIVLNSLLIPRFGIMGAAVATMVAIVLSNTMNLMFLYHHMKFQPFNRQYLFILASMVSSALIVHLLMGFMDFHYLYRILLVSTLYALLYGLQIYRYLVNQEEKNMMRSMWKSISKKA